MQSDAIEDWALRILEPVLQALPTLTTFDLRVRGKAFSPRDLGKRWVEIRKNHGGIFRESRRKPKLDVEHVEIGCW